MDSSLKLSIIVPAFRSEKTIRKCINSILNQTIGNFECIVVLKKSEDKTSEFFKKNKDPRLKVIIQNGEGGPGYARNLGIRVCLGKYIGFVEADDFIEPDFYEKLIKVAEGEGADLAVGRLFGTKSYKNITSSLISFEEKIKLFNNAASFDKIYRSELVKKNNIQFQEDVRFEDNIFILRVMLHSKKLVIIDDALYHYCPTPWSKQYRVKLQKDTLKVIEKVAEFCKENNLKKTDRCLIRDFLYRSFVKIFIDDEEVFNCFNKYFTLTLKMKIRRCIRKIKNN